MKRHIAFIVAMALFDAVLVLFDSAAGKVRAMDGLLEYSLESEGYDNVRVYDASDVTAEVLESRAGVTVVERCIGIVTDAESGDGEVLNAADSDYDYIGYRNVGRDLEDGEVLVSYMVFSNTNEDIDGIEERYDFSLGITQEEAVRLCGSSK